MVVNGIMEKLRTISWAIRVFEENIAKGKTDPSPNSCVLSSMHCITMHPVLVTSQKPDQNVDPKSPLSLSLKVFIPDICHFFTQAKFLENKIYTKKKCVNYDKIHRKLPIFCVKSVKIYTGQKIFTREFSWLS